MHIISANYRDRKSPNRWLIRHATQEINQAQAVPSLTAQKVAFVESHGLQEEGFDCWIVGQAESAEVATDESNQIRTSETKLRFERDHFETQKGKRVDSCTSVRLTPDGSVYAILSA